MKLFALVLMLVALVALPALAQLPTATDPLAGVIVQGKIFQTVATIDTLHSTTTKASSVAATKWRGPLPTDNGKKLPNAWYVYARKPFYFKGIFPSGDSTGVYSTNIDTTTINPKYLAQAVYPVWTVIKSPLKQLRLDPTAADTVYVVPLVIK